MTIKKVGDEWCAFSEDGSRSFGCFSTREKAEERLQEVEFFKQQNFDRCQDTLRDAIASASSPEEGKDP